MTGVEPRWPEPPGWSLTRVGYGDPDVAALVEQVQAFYVERYGGPDETPLDPGAGRGPARGTEGGSVL